jgi:hypothetical protein
MQCCGADNEVKHMQVCNSSGGGTVAGPVAVAGTVSFGF